MTRPMPDVYQGEGGQTAPIPSVAWFVTHSIQTCTIVGISNLTDLVVKVWSIFTESTHWADSVTKLLCPSVCVCVYLCNFFFKTFFLRLITPIYEGRKSNRPIAKRILRVGGGGNQGNP